MEPAHRTLLLIHRLAFVENVEANDLLGYLYQDHVISENDKDKIEGKVTRRYRIEHLLDTIPRKGPKAFGKFCIILRKFDQYSYLADLLMPLDESNPDSGFDQTDSSPAKPTKQSKMTCGSKSNIMDAYPMCSNPLGWCFIINNMHFYNMPDRDGSQTDAINLQKLFNSFGFRVSIVNNVDTDDIREKLTDLAQKTDHGDCLVVCILSHGLSGQIYGVEGKLITVSEILDIINNGSSLLKGKPKLFLIQACRSSDNKDKKVKKKIHSSQVTSNPQEEIIRDEEKQFVSPTEKSAFHSFIEESKMHAYSDMILAYSTFPGDVSWRHTEHGSYFIDCVIDVFEKFSHSEDVLSMLVKVNQAVLNKLKDEGVVQIPAPVFTLTKKLYLNP